MEKVYEQYKLQQVVSQKRGRKVVDFQLLPQNPIQPIIKSQPVRNFYQYTHTDDQGNYTPIAVINGNTIKVLKGTTIEFAIVAEDPSNLANSLDQTNLKYVWKQNNSEITELTLLNSGSGTSRVYLDGKFTTPQVNGEYFCEVSNQYGTTISDSFNLEVIDPAENYWLSNNIIKNGTGNKGTQDWELSDDIEIKVFESGIERTKNFASIYSDAKITFDFATGEAQSRVVGEYPFTYNQDSNWTNFNDIWNTVQAGQTVQDNWWNTQFPPSIVKNEHPDKPYAQFYPSIQSIDQYNNNKQGLISDYSIIPTYFTRRKLLFEREGGSVESTMVQTIDLSDIADVIDGKVSGITNVQAQFFAYLANGISKYNYALLDDSGKVQRILNTYVLTAQWWSNFIQGVAYPKYTIPIWVSRIEMIPVTQDSVDVNINLLDINGQPINTETITGPTNRDVFAVKERFLLSTYTNKLFNLLTSFTKDIPVYIFGQKYFNITKSKALNANQQWIAQNYPLYKSTDRFSRWETGDFTLKGFDRGAAAFFGYDKQIQIPPKTRSIQVSLVFSNTSKAIQDTNNALVRDGNFTWQYSDIYAEHLADNTWYEYNNPKAAATQIKLILAANQLDRQDTRATYFTPPVNVWKTNKQWLGENIHDETKQLVVYNFTNGQTQTSNTQFVQQPEEYLPTSEEAVRKQPRVEKGTTIPDEKK